MTVSRRADILFVNRAIACPSTDCDTSRERGTHAAKLGTVNTKAATASILLVDDDAELLKALTKVLEKDGYEVFAHADAQSAMNFVNASKKRFDLVITDVSMPGVKGTTFLAAVKTAFPRVPVIIITAFGDWGQYMDALRSGAFEYLSKPLDKTELLATVRHALNDAGQKASV